MNPTVYIETTVVSYLTAWPSRDLIRAAQQQITRDWWRMRRKDFECFASELVLVEAAAGDPDAAAERLAVLNTFPMLDIPPGAEQLAERLLASAALPQKASSDALHVAIATANGMDYLLTWNCRHLANAILRDRIEQTCEDAGYKCPTICTPEELFGEEP